jgi:hypothetical protein
MSSDNIHKHIGATHFEGFIAGNLKRMVLVMDLAY